MAKYLTEFNTYAEYQAATLSLPNVSLIKSTGKVYYKNIFAGASLGDILMWDNVNNKLVATFGGNWSTESFPIAQYEPIAINIYPADQASDGKSRFMALRWASNTSDTGSTNNVSLIWGKNNVQVSNDKTALNGRSNSNIMLAVADGTTANTQDACAAFAACNRFRTSGTSAGDWYLPSRGELSIYSSNYNTINNKIQLIKNASESIVETVNTSMWSSSEGTGYSDGVGADRMKTNGGWGNYGDSRGNRYSVRPMIAL